MFSNLPSEVLETIGHRLPQTHLRSLGRTGRTGRAAANAVHAARQNRARRALASPELASVMSKRRFAQLVVAAVVRAEAASRVATTESDMRRAGFEPNLFEDHPVPGPATSYGRWKDVGNAEEIQSDLSRTAYGNRFEIRFIHPSLGAQVTITGGANMRHDGKPALMMGTVYEPVFPTTLEGAGLVAEIANRLERTGYAVFTAERPIRRFSEQPAQATPEPRWAGMASHTLRPYFPPSGRGAHRLANGTFL
jgi:hypothetical protein